MDKGAEETCFSDLQNIANSFARLHCSIEGLGWFSFSRAGLTCLCS